MNLILQKSEDILEISEGSLRFNALGSSWRPWSELHNYLLLSLDFHYQNVPEYSIFYRISCKFKQLQLPTPQHQCEWTEPEVTKRRVRSKQETQVLWKDWRDSVPHSGCLRYPCSLSVSTFPACGVSDSHACGVPIFKWGSFLWLKKKRERERSNMVQ